MFVYLRVRSILATCGSQETTFGSLSSSMVCVLGMELRLSGLMASAFAPLVKLYFIFWEPPVHSISSFVNWVFSIHIAYYFSSLYSLDANALSDTQCVKIFFSHSVCLFLCPVNISFTIRKHFSFMRSHLGNRWAYLLSNTFQ